MSPVCGDFPLVHPRMNGSKTQFTWIGTTDVTDKTARMNGIAKIDLFHDGSAAKNGGDACVARIVYGQGRYGGEAFFVPRYEDAARCAGEPS